MGVCRLRSRVPSEIGREFRVIGHSPRKVLLNVTSDIRELDHHAALKTCLSLVLINMSIPAAQPGEEPHHEDGRLTEDGSAVEVELLRSQEGASLGCKPTGGGLHAEGHRLDQLPNEALYGGMEKGELLVDQGTSLKQEAMNLVPWIGVVGFS